MFIVRDAADDSCDVLIELVFCIRCCGHCRGYKLTRVTGPTVVLRRRARSRSEPLLPGSIMFNKLFRFRFIYLVILQTKETSDKTKSGRCRRGHLETKVQSLPRTLSALLIPSPVSGMCNLPHSVPLNPPVESPEGWWCPR